VAFSVKKPPILKKTKGKKHGLFNISNSRNLARLYLEVKKNKLTMVVN